MADQNETPNPFCKSLPTQLAAWDATALRCAQECPRKYELSMVHGYRSGNNIDLDFGTLYHAAVEHFDRQRASGLSRAEATYSAYSKALEDTWINGAPWSGQYIPVWRCSNAIAQKTRTKYLCDAARGWWAGTQERCPKCGNRVTNHNAWVPENKKKNRYTLLRAVLEYCDAQPEEGGIKPIVFPDGQIALELSFRLPLDILNPDGEPYMLCGHLDSMVDAFGEHCFRERKTTSVSIGPGFFDRYNPDIQFDVYDLACWLLFSDKLEIHANMAEVMQIGTDFARLQRGFVNISEGRRNETLADIKATITEMEGYARSGYYPKRTSSCNSHGRACQFRRICSEDPSYRQALLNEHFRIDKWNPLKER